MQPRSWASLALLVTLAALGCGESTGPTIEGTFEASVSGALSDEMSGTAEFGIFAGEGLGLSFRTTDGAGLLGIGNLEEARPGPGSYTMGDPSEEGVFFALYLRQTMGGAASLVSRSGTLVITSSTSERLEGSFSFAAFGTIAGDPGTELEVWIDGTFSATCARRARCD
jgi:hypothetical protein